MDPDQSTLGSATSVLPAPPLPHRCLLPDSPLLPAPPLTFSRRMILAVWEMTLIASSLLWRSMKMMPLSQQAHPTVPMYMISFLAMGTQRSGMTSTMPGGWMGEERIHSCPVAPRTNQPRGCSDLASSSIVPTLSSLQHTHSPELLPHQLFWPTDLQVHIAL